MPRARKQPQMQATKAHASVMKAYASGPKIIVDPNRKVPQPKIIVDPKRGRTLATPKAKVIVTPRAKRGRSL